MSSAEQLVLGSRGSQLALWQSEFVKAELEKRFPKLHIRIETIKTTGDKILDSPLSKIGDKGLFTREIEHALLDHRIDAAVHSLKDLPTELPEGLTIGAVLRREDVHDVFIAHPKKSYTLFDELPHGAVIATGSLRRKCQILNYRPDLNIIELRGNLNTRLEKLDASSWDGMVLARAGVLRLGLERRITETLPLEKILPAVGQGALAIEIREGDQCTLQYVKPLSSESATTATRAERAFLHRLEGGCQVPIGAYGRIEDNEFLFDGLIGSLDGKQLIRGKIHGMPSEAEQLGKELAQTLLESGGEEILSHIRNHAPVNAPTV